MTPPTIEPISVAEAKAFLQYGLDVQDDVIASLIATARAEVEQYCQRALLDQVWQLDAGGPPGVLWTSSGRVLGDESSESHADFFVRNLVAYRDAVGYDYAAPAIELPFAAPLLEVLTVKVDDVAQQTDTYRVDASTAPARLYLLGATTGWLEVTYRCGVETAALVPPALVGAVRNLFGLLFTFRGQVPPDARASVLAAVDSYRLADLV